jgi:DNA-binding MarR family transcriptional regulator
LVEHSTIEGSTLFRYDEIAVITLSSDKLTGHDLDTWNSYLKATRVLFDTLDRTLTEEAGLSLPDYIVLFRLSQSGDDGTRMSDLADAAVFSRSRISHAIRRLEDEGLVERRACPTDRRGSYGYLTESGRTKLALAEAVHTEVVRRCFLEPVGDTDSVFREATDRILSTLGSGPADPAC